MSLLMCSFKCTRARRTDLPAFDFAPVQRFFWTPTPDGSSSRYFANVFCRCRWLFLSRILLTLNRRCSSEHHHRLLPCSLSKACVNAPVLCYYPASVFDPRQRQYALQPVVIDGRRCNSSNHFLPLVSGSSHCLSKIACLICQLLLVGLPFEAFGHRSVEARSCYGQSGDVFSLCAALPSAPLQRALNFKCCVPHNVFISPDSDQAQDTLFSSLDCFLVACQLVICPRVSMRRSICAVFSLNTSCHTWP